jgi:protein-tyrosine-phosphatase/predicted ATP-grasp superfamily ATP-dependent carboligase
MSGAALVLDGHSRAALETLQSLGRLGIAVDLASNADCLGWHSRYCRHKLRQPEAGEWVADLFAAGEYALVVPSTELSLRALLRLPESHAARRAAVLPATRSLEVALDKQLTWELAGALGVPVPASRLIASMHELTEPPEFPVVLKPVASLAQAEGQLVGLAPRVVRTRGDWRRILERLLPLCAVQEQAYVPGRGAGIECLFRHGKALWGFQHERLHELPLTGGGSSYRRSAPLDPDLLRASTALLEELQWHGVAMVEFRGSAQTGYRLMEINPRLWGSRARPMDAGVDFPKGLWCLATGADPGPQPRYRTGHYTRNLEMDFDWLKENLRADHGDALLLTAPRLGSLLEFGRVLTGKESWDHFDVKDWRVWGRVLERTLAAVRRSAMSLFARALRPLLLAHRHRRTLVRVRGQAHDGIRRVLFVCYGNICRSPLAELHARQVSPELEAASAGFHDSTGRAAPVWYRNIAAEHGVDLADKRSLRIDAKMVQWAQLIVLSDLHNLDLFEREFPDAMHKATMLGFFLPQPEPSIEDPYTLDSFGARAAVRKVMAAVDGLILWTRNPAS